MRNSKWIFNQILIAQKDEYIKSIIATKHIFVVLFKKAIKRNSATAR